MNDLTKIEKGIEKNNRLLKNCNSRIVSLIIAVFAMGIEKEKRGKVLPILCLLIPILFTVEDLLDNWADDE